MNLSIEEPIEIIGIGKTTAKVDTGNNAYNVLHATNIKILNCNYVNFTTIDNKSLKVRYNRLIDVHIGSGNHENRPVIFLDIQIKGKKFTHIPFSLADRTENEEKVLLGELFLKDVKATIEV